MSWIDRLQKRWKLAGTGQVIMVLIVFACTGFTVVFLKRPLVAYFTGEEGLNLWFTFLYYLLILPVYNLLLLFYGLLLGQFSFFWNFEKRMWKRMTGRRSDDDQG